MPFARAQLIRALGRTPVADILTDYKQSLSE
jgi:hypothetical protein